MRTLVIVSRDKSDLFFANQLAATLDVVGIVVENQIPERDRSSLARKALKYASTPGLFFRKVIEVADRKFVEPRQTYNDPRKSLDFGPQGLALDVPEAVPVLQTTGVNDINSAECRDWIAQQEPDVIAVCGASILRKPVLSIARRGVLNLHGGLSQFYRGLFTTDWAIHNREPECVGATVHFVSEGIDDGHVVFQGRPVIEASDHPNSLYEKVVRLGTRMMIDAIRDFETSERQAAPLTSPGRLYLNDMFDLKAKRRTWRQIENGVLEEYLRDRGDRDQRINAAMLNGYAAPSATTACA